MKKPLSLSIVIPVYNEEFHLKDCLDSIALQSLKPLEVIVVDNNSTDNSVKIARTYPFVTVLFEKRQHQAFAQYTGFKAATGDIIGRIDADAILPKNWAKNVTAYFDQNADVVAITGNHKAYDIPLGKFATWIFVVYHQFLSHIASGHEMLWGSNCALRSQAVPQVIDELLLRNDIWEDYDLSFCLAPYGKIIRLSTITIRNSFRAAHEPVKILVKYQIRAVRTYWLKAVWWRAALFTFFWSTLVIIYPIPLLDRILWNLKAWYSKSR